MEKIFFNSSLPRSGSTLLQNIFAQNPDFYVTPTSGVLELVFGARGNYTSSPEFQAQDPELMKKGFQGFCKHGLEGFFNSVTDKKYVVDKSRGWGIHYDMLDFFYPEPKIVCMVRDIRDILCSMEKNFRKNQHLSDPIVDHANLTGTSTPKRVDAWLASQPVGMAIERLNEIIRQGIDKKIHFVKFEDLCMYPQATMDKVYNYLEVDSYKHDFDNIIQVTQEDDTVYGIYGDHNIRTRLEPVPSTAKTVLGKDVTDWIWNNFQWFNQYFRYSK
jgi:sulfotransferase